MQNLMKQCGLLTKITTNDANTNRKQEAWVHSKYIDALISVRTGSTTVSNNLIATTSTHLALTAEKGITTNNRLSLNGTTYIIDFVIDDTPLSQLFLKVM